MCLHFAICIYLCVLPKLPTQENIIIKSIFHIVISVPSAPPTSVRVTRVIGATITVQWGAVNCIHQNGEITEYLVKYRAEPNGEVLVVNASEKQITLPNMMPFTNYSIEVAAVNSAGIGNFSSATMTVTRQSEYTIIIAILKSEVV